MHRVDAMTTPLSYVLLSPIAALGLVTGCGFDGGRPGDGGSGGARLSDAHGDWSFDDAADGPCGAGQRKAETAPLDMIIALDTSFSMDFLGKWPAVKSALRSFFNDPSFADLSVGLQYFPLRAQCSVSAYATPAVGIGPLPSQAATLSASLEGQTMYGGTPLVPMLQGTVQYVHDWAAAHPDHKAIVVLATDGIPDDTCLTGTTPNTLENVVSVAAAAKAMQPSVPIFVIGVGSELVALNQISQAGGTGNAFLVDTGTAIEQAFLSALTRIRKTMQCEYELPKMPSEWTRIDIDSVNVTYTYQGTTETLPYVGSLAGCSTAPDKGWYYDNPAAPRRVQLCEGTCQNGRWSEGAEIGVVYGCRTVIP